MDYDQRLAKELKNPEAYMWWEDTTPISSLDGMADDLLSKDSIESRIAVLFIYHQLAEEIMKQVAKYCDLVTRASMYPIRYSNSLNLNNKKYSEIKIYIQNSIEFHNKTKLLTDIVKLNDLRNTYGHDLVTNYSKINSKEHLSNLQELFASLTTLFTSVMRWFYKEIKRIRQSPEIQELFQRY